MPTISKFFLSMLASIAVIVAGHSQTEKSNKIFKDFEMKVRKELGRKVDFNDSSIYLVYGDKYNYAIGVYHDSGGEKLSISYKEDTVHLSDSGSMTWRRLPTSDVLDWFYVHKKNSLEYEINFPDSTTLILVTCSMDSWIQFYLDDLVGTNEISLPFTVDVFSSKQKKVSHRRTLYVYKYSAGKGFRPGSEIVLLAN